ncbi:FUSC family protein [Vagococcus luciliae]|uniref:Integral membrane bound transporter domain-containing protein n=1 Tax=Vagococcus luciliae TaxID=2920380 RepID=A0ABY5P141_9ENTE|nr:FUSC family protein [Vagococcus luciliae]UUV99519.1 hypothetical protein G314FT_16800 [Vagococcus luciliae]
MLTKLITHIQKNFRNNLIDYTSNLLFILLFTLIFGKENLLPIVALSVGFLMFPKINFGVKNNVLTLTNLLLFPLGGIVSQLPHDRPLGLFFVYAGFTFLILLLTAEPIVFQYSIPYLINFLFCQATPVDSSNALNRIICLFLGSIVLSVLAAKSTKKQPLSNSQLTLKEQITRSLTHPFYLFKMTLSVSIAMTIAILLHAPKPLWISIVAMSLTEIHFSETVKKTRERIIGTTFGVIVFYLFLVKLIPTPYAIVFILTVGFISYFLVDYQHKTIVNSIAAMNAALVIFPSGISIANRFIGLFIGIVIAMIVAMIGYMLQKLIVR